MLYTSDSVFLVNVAFVSKNYNHKTPASWQKMNPKVVAGLKITIAPKSQSPLKEFGLS